MAKDYAGRARQEFVRAARTIEDEDLNRIFADHAAKGLVRSGATIKVSIRAFEDRTRTALTNLQGQFSTQLHSRGGEWRRAMDALDVELTAHIEAAPQILAKALRVASGKVGPGPVPTEGAAVSGFNKLIGEVAERLREEQHQFRNEWTSPPGKSWIERHPALYATGMLIGGALLGQLVAVLVKALE